LIALLVEFTQIRPEAVHTIADFMARASNGGVNPYMEEVCLADDFF